MKLKYFLLTFSVLLSGFFYSCDDDDDSIVVPAETRLAFEQKYPSVGKVEWEYESKYIVAEFWYNNVETSAWFDSQGNWYMTESDITYASLPQVVKNSFEATEYAKWRIDDIDMIEQLNTEKFYVIEVESGNQEVDLYFSTDGILFKTIMNSPGFAYAPQIVSAAMQTFIDQRYPQARIIDVEAEGAMIEVDIIHENRSKDVYFDLKDQWMYTSWDVYRSEWPTSVTSLVTSGEYTGYIIDDVDYVETPTGNHYLVELEKGNSEIQVKVEN